MNHITSEFIERASAVLIFILSLTLLIFMTEQQSKFIKVVKEELRDRKEMYVQYVDIAYENNVTYEEVVGTLLSDKLEYDVEIEGYVYLKEDYQYQKVDLLTIPKRNYLKSYVYTVDGIITKVIYQAN